MAPSTFAEDDERKMASRSSTVIELSLFEAATQVARKKVFVAKVTLAALAVGAVLCFVLPTRYQANTKILTPQQTPSSALLLSSASSGDNSGGGGGGLASLATQGLGLKNPNDKYIGMLESRPVRDALIQRFSLQGVYGSKDMTAARKKLTERTTIQSEKSGFITVAVIDADKKRAVELANAYTEQLRQLTRSLATTEAGERRLFYEEQLKDAQASLVVAEAKFQQVQLKKGMVQPLAQTGALITSMSTLRAQITAKEVQLQAYRSYLTDNNANVELAKNELASLKAQLAAMEPQGRTSGAGGLGIEDIPGAGMDYLQAEREVKYRQAVYDLLMKQYDSARLDEAKEAAVIQVVEPPIVPDRKASPVYWLVLTVAGVLGLFVGVLIALLSWLRQVLSADPERARQMSALRDAVLGSESTK